MTAPDDPTRPAERDLETRLRSSLAARAASVGIESDEEDLRRRIEGRSDLPLGATVHRLRWSYPLLRAAAVLVVLAAIATVAVVATRPDRHDPVVRTDPGSATGWYIPTGLPAGWKVRAVELIQHDVEQCPCARHLWHDERTGNLIATQVAVLSLDTPSGTDPSGPQVDLGGGITGHEAGDHLIEWTDGPGGRHFHSVSSSDAVDRLELIAAARREAAATGSRPPGYELLTSARTDRTTRTEPLVLVLVSTGDGSRALTWRIHPAWDPYGLPWDVIDHVRMHLGTGAAGPYLSIEREEESLVTALFDGASMTIEGPNRGFPGHRSDVSAAGLEAYARFARTLRPATSAEWARFVRSVPEHDDAAIAPSLDDLVTYADGGGRPAATTMTTTGGTRTTSTDRTTVTSACAQGCDGQRIPVQALDGSVATATTHAPDDRFSDLSGLTFGLEVGAPSVVAGDALPGSLVVRNSTDHAIRLGACTEAYMISTMQPVGGRALLLLNEDLECLSKGTLIRPHDEVRHSLVTPDVGGWIARDGPAALGNYGGTLAPGRYLPEVQIPGRTTMVLVRAANPIAVTAHPCGGYSSDLVLQMTWPKLSDAEQIARWFGYHLVVASVDGVPRDLSKDLDCTRLRAIVVGGQVTGFDIG